MAAIGYALTVGLNSVDPHHYEGWSGELNACEADAKDLASLLTSQGFQVETLLTKSATRERVLSEIKKVASVAKAGDLFVFTNSSHGGQLPDQNGDEDDGYDETMCFYDGELVDDELYSALARFAAGVRILVLSDSCHSGTVIKMGPGHERLVSPPLAGTPRAMPPSIAARTYQAHRAMYDKILKNPELKSARDQVKASVVLISGCMDNQTSLDGTFNGLFTGTLLRVWNAGKFKGSYKKFWKKIVSLMPSDQSPNLFWATQRDAKFEAQKPFKI